MQHYPGPSTYGAGMDGRMFDGQYRGLNPFEDNNFYNMSPMGGRMTNNMFGSAAMMFLGRNLMPMPQRGSNQNVFDALYRRDFDMQRLQVQQQAVANLAAFKRMGGVNQDGMLFQIGSSMFGGPDGPLMNALSPLLGGNPVKSAMSAWSNMRGINMATFGTTQDISASAIGNAENILSHKFYNWNKINGQDVANARRTLSGAIQHNYGSSAVEGLAGEFGMTDTGFKPGSNRYANLGATTGQVNKIDELLRHLTKDNASDTQKEVFRIAREGIKIKEVGAMAEQDLKKVFADANNPDISKFNNTHQAVDAVSRALEMHQEVLKGRGMDTPRSIDFRRNYGFNYEDLGSGYVAASKLMMINGRRLDNKGFGGQTAEAFYTHAPEAMDAMRGLFGNDLSGTQLMSAASNHLGVSGIDLTDPASARRYTDMARNLKGMARVLNIEVQAFLDLTEEMKQVAAGLPALKNMGGYEMSNILTKQSAQVGALLTTMTPEAIRRAGGQGQILRDHAFGALQQANEPVSQWMGAAYHYFKDQPGVLQQIANYSNNGDQTPAGTYAFVNSLARRTSNPMSALSYFYHNTAGAQLGREQYEKDHPGSSIAEIGGSAAVQTWMQMIGAQGGGRATIGVLNKLLADPNYDPVALEADPRFNSMPAIQAATHNVVSSGALTAYMAKHGNPQMRQKFAEIQAKKERNKTYEATANQLFAHLQSSPTTMLFNQLLNGRVAEAGVTAFLEPFGLDPQGHKAFLNEAYNIDKIKDSSNLTDVISHAGRGDVQAGLVEKLGALQDKFKISNENIAQIASGHVANAEELLNSGRANKIGQEDINAIISGARGLGAGFTSNFHGKYSNFDDVKRGFVSEATKAWRDRVLANKTAAITKEAQEALFRAAGPKSNLSPEQRKISQGILSVTGRGMSLEDIKSLSTATLSESGEIPENIRKVAVASGLLIGGIAGAPTQNKAVLAFRQSVIDNVQKTIAGTGADSFVKQNEDMKTQAERLTKTPVDVLSDMFTFLKQTLNFDDIAGAIRELAKL